MDAPVAVEETATPKPPMWQRAAGLVMVLISALLALIALLHGAGRIAVLGLGGLKLPMSSKWVGFEGDPAKTLTLAAEQWSGILSVWATYLALVVALIAWGLPRLGRPEERTSLQLLISDTATTLFALVATAVTVVSVPNTATQPMMVIGVPLVVAVIPAFLGCLGILIVAIRALTASIKVFLAEQDARPKKPKSAKPAKAAKPAQTPKPAKVKKTTKPTGKPVASGPQKVRINAAGKVQPVAPRKPKGKGGAK